jgi:hypothetical protein
MPELVETKPRPDDPVTPEERRQITRLITRLLVAVLAVIVAAGVATLVTRDDDSDFGGEITLVNAIGPLSGRDIAQYVFERKRELRSATDVRAAVVSLDAYMKENDARKLVEGLNVRAVIVAAPGGRPAVVTGSLAEWADKARRDAAEERAEFEKLLPTYDPTEELDFVNESKEQIGRLSRIEQTASADGDMVFAVVVVGPAEQLRRIGDTSGVRVVDIGEGPAVPALANIRGIRPEETSVSGEPLTRPV